MSRGTSKWLGITKKMNNGMNATMIEFNSQNDVVVQFEDGEIVRSQSARFYTGMIAHPTISSYSMNTKKKYIGKQNKNNNGEIMTIVDYVDSTKIKVRFEDGTEKFAEMKTFKNGLIKNPNANINKRTGEVVYQHCGLNAKIIKYVTCKNITIEFEDGVIVKNQIYRIFKKGMATHPERPMGAAGTLLRNGFKVCGVAFFHLNKPQMFVILPNGNKDVMSWEEIYSI